MKNVKAILMLSLVLATTICFAQTSRAQTAEVVERLADGSAIVVIDGVKYRALTPDQLREQQQRKILLQSATEENAILREQNTELKGLAEMLKKDAAAAGEIATLHRQRAEEYKALFEAERDLRLKAEKLPARKSVFERILSHPVTQVVIVATSTVIAAKQR